MSGLPGVVWRRGVGAGVPFLLTLVLVAFGLRAIMAVALDQHLYAAGCGGFLSEDEIGYDRVAWIQARAWRGAGPPVELADRYLLTPYTYAEAAMYFAIGHHPLGMKLINGVFGALAAGIVFLTALRLFDHTAARVSGLAAAFFPTTFLFSIVNLKDAMYLFLVALLLWLLTVFLVSGRHWLLAPIIGTLLVAGGLRIYMQVFLGFLVPVSVMVQRAAQFPRKWLTSVALVSGCAAVLWFGGGARWAVGYMPYIEQQRFASAQGAASGYAALSSAAKAIAGADVTAPGGRGRDSVSDPGALTTPTRGLSCLLADTSSAPNVKPLARPDTSIATLPPAAGGSALLLSFAAAAPWRAQPDVPVEGLTSTQSPSPIGASMGRLLGWIPRGLSFALAAPFPWEAHRTIERLTIPEMLLWYAMLVLASIGVVVHRDSWRAYVHVLVYIAGMLLIFAIGQGNFGTLVRQRSMMLAPFVFLFSGAGAAWLWEQWRSRRRAERGSEEEKLALAHREFT